MLKKNQIFLEYNRYVPTKDCFPINTFYYSDYSIIKTSQIDLKFRQFLSGEINDINIREKDLYKINEYLHKNKHKSLENVLASAFVIDHIYKIINKEHLLAVMQGQEKLAEEYVKKMHSSKIIYDNGHISPKINGKAIDFHFFDFLMSKKTVSSPVQQEISGKQELTPREEKILKN